MKRELIIHFSFTFAFLIFSILFHRWFELRYLLLLLGGVVGTLLPDVDHLIYIYFFGPQELTSQRIFLGLQKRQLIPTFELLAATRSERKKLIFHTAFFQLIFLIMAFWVITSSGNIFGRGLVLAFALHLVVDQLIDLLEVDNLDNWFSQPPLIADLDKQKATLYWVAMLLAVLFLGFLL